MLQTDVDRLASKQQQQTGDCIMLFELAIDGHHAVYIRHLVRYWCEKALLGHFYLIVGSKFLEKHADIIAITKEYPEAKISFLPLTATEEATLITGASSLIHRKTRSWQEWHLMCAYASRLKVSHCFLGSFDFFQWPFLLGKRPPCPISGIYFKPTFHYCTFSTYRPTFKTFIQQWREKLTLSAIFRQSYLYRLFCLDPFAVEALNRTFSQGKAVTLADPVPTYPADLQRSDLRERLQIQKQRRVFLLLGALTKRKGIEQLLEAITLLPDILCQQLCLLIAGHCNQKTKLIFQSKVSQVRHTHPVQIIEHYEFISEREVQEYFQMTDVVLAPYQKHIGMSGILLQAAAAGKPVLSSNYGLMGELVFRYQLGLAVDSTQASEIAKALTQFLQKPVTQFYSLEKMKKLTQQNTIEKFSSTIFNELMTDNE
jgi:glycosyltransferase involved in cell wall biosynthesis